MYTLYNNNIYTDSRGMVSGDTFKYTTFDCIISYYLYLLLYKIRHGTLCCRVHSFNGWNGMRRREK